MNLCSNTSFLAAEFSFLKQYCTGGDDVTLPTLQDMKDIQSQIKRALTYKRSLKEINAQVELKQIKQIEEGCLDINVAYMKSQYEIKHAQAKEVYLESGSHEARVMMEKFKLLLD